MTRAEPGVYMFGLVLRRETNIGALRELSAYAAAAGVKIVRTDRALVFAAVGDLSSVLDVMSYAEATGTTIPGFPAIS